MRPGSTVAVLLTFAGVASASAATVDARSLTMVDLRPEIFEGEARTSLAMLEFVNLRARGIDSALAKELGVQISAWGSVEPVGPADKVLDGDVDLAFVEGRLLKKRLKLRLGRQLVVGGVARASFIDGLLADFAGPAGVGATVSFGMPVTRRFSRVSAGQWELDARLRYAPRPTLWSVGAAFSHVEEKNQVLRQELGLDGRVVIARKLTLVGAAMWSLPDERLSELDLGPRLLLSESLELSAGYRRTAPDLLLPRTSILSVFAESGRDELGASLYFEPAGWLSLFADARGLLYEEDGADDAGVEATVRATARPNRDSPTSLSCQLRLLRAPVNGFVQGRLGAAHRLGAGFSAAADLEVYYLEEEINGERLSVAGSASLGWAFAKPWQLGVTLFQASTPDFESRTELMAKLTYVLPTWGTP